MKIIISPSKTQNFKPINFNKTQHPQYLDKTDYLLSILKSFSKEDLQKIMKIKGELLDTTYHNFQNYDSLNYNPALFSYTGMVFKQLDLNQYTDKNYHYINHHIRILSAFYGLLKPFDLIKPYRLDMTMKIMDESLYSYWELINKDLKDEDIVINLASDEYSHMIKRPLINISFLEKKDGDYKNISTYSKKARGRMLDFMIKEHIQSLDDIKKFNKDDYNFNNSLSTDQTIVFTR